MSFGAAHFKGWTKPGPVPPGESGAGPGVAPGETLDALSGRFRLFQLAAGHRFSTDDVLTAWYGTTHCPRAGRILELGAGLGTVGLMAAWRLPGAQFVTVEAQTDSVRLAQKSVAWNGLADRFEIRTGDFRTPGVLGPGELFDLVLGSPPYFPPGTGPVGDHPQKVACRFEVRGGVEDYLATAARQLAPGGIFACVFPVTPIAQHDRVRAAAAAHGLVVVRWRPVVLREGDPPLLGLFAFWRATDLPERVRGDTWTEPPLVIRTATGEVHPEYRAVKLSFGFPP